MRCLAPDIPSSVLDESSTLRSMHASKLVSRDCVQSLHTDGGKHFRAENIFERRYGAFVGIFVSCVKVFFHFYSGNGMVHRVYAAFYFLQHKGFTYYYNGEP